MKIGSALAFILGISMLFSTNIAAFTDISDHWAKGTIDWAAENKIVDGYEDGSFQPDRTVTEAEFVKMFVSAFGVTPPESSFNKHWADDLYNYINFQDYPVQGYSDSESRDSMIKRSAVAEIIASADGMNYRDNDNIRYLYLKGYSMGKDGGEFTIKSYKGNDPLTRAEAIQFIKNVKDKGMTELKKRPGYRSSTRDLPDILDETLEPVPKRIFDTLKAKLKDQKFNGYTVDGYNDYVVISPYNANGQNAGGVSLSLSKSPNDLNSLVIWNRDDLKSIELAVDIMLAYGLDVGEDMKATIQTVKSKDDFEVDLNGTSVQITSVIATTYSSIYKMEYKMIVIHFR